MRPAHELAARLYAALAAGDVDALDAVVASDLRAHVTPGLPAGMGGDHAGREAMRERVWWQFGRLFVIAAEPTEMVDLVDGRLLVRGTYRGSCRHTGRPLQAEFTHLITCADDRIVALDQLTDSARFVEALGSPPDLETLRYDVRRGVVRITLARPEARNAIDMRLATELEIAARRAVAEPGLRLIVLAGEGSDLTVGGDISEFGAIDAAGLPDLLTDMTTPFHQAFRILADAPAPILAVARGAVAGGGIGLLHAADLVLASRTLRIVTAFGAIGLTGDGGGTWWLPKLVGPKRAAEMYLRNRPLTAEEALTAGVVTSVHADEDLDAAAEALIAELAAGPTRAFAGMRRLLRAGWTTELDRHLHHETSALAASARSEDAAHAIGAFLGRERPQFNGR